MSLHCPPRVIDATDWYRCGVVGGEQQSIRNVSTLLPFASNDFLWRCESSVPYLLTYLLHGAESFLRN